MDLFREIVTLFGKIFTAVTASVNGNQAISSRTNDSGSRSRVSDDMCTTPRMVGDGVPVFMGAVTKTRRYAVGRLRISPVSMDQESLNLALS